MTVESTSKYEEVYLRCTNCSHEGTFTVEKGTKFPNSATVPSPIKCPSCWAYSLVNV